MAIPQLQTIYTVTKPYQAFGSNFGTKPIQTQEVKNLLIRLFVLKWTTMDRKLLSASENVPAKFEKFFGTSNVTITCFAGEGQKFICPDKTALQGWGGS